MTHPTNLLAPWSGTPALLAGTTFLQCCKCLPCAEQTRRTASLPRDVLRLTVAKRPVFLADLDQVDENILTSHFQNFMQTVRHGLVKTLLQLNRAARI